MRQAMRLILSVGFFQFDAKASCRAAVKHICRAKCFWRCAKIGGGVRAEIPGGLQGPFFVCAAIRFYGVSRGVKRAIAPPLFNLINIKKKGWRRITMKKTCFYKDLIYLCLAFAHKRALKQGLCDLIEAGRGQGNARRRARETWQMPSE